MSSVKVTIELKCAQCGKKLSLHGKSVSSKRRRFSRYSTSRIRIPDVWTTDWIADEGEKQDSIEIQRGYSYSDGDEEDMYCSIACVMAFVQSVLPKLKPYGEDAAEEEFRKQAMRMARASLATAIEWIDNRDGSAATWALANAVRAVKLLEVAGSLG